MPSTTHGLPYPTAADAPNGPSQMQALAEGVDTKLLTGGKSIIATTETRTSTSYGLLTTPDRVQSVVLPTDGLLMIWYQALAMADSGDARAAIFIGSNQLKLGEADGAPITEAAVMYGSGFYRRLHSVPFGLLSSDAVTADATDVTTGQVVGSYAYAWSIEMNGVIRNSANGAIGTTNDGAHSVPSGLGGPCWVTAAAGTYDISVQFKVTSSGPTLSVKSRKLWVRAVSF